MVAGISVERSQAGYEALVVSYKELLEAAHRVRGALELVEALKTASALVAVWLVGHAEVLRKRLADLEGRLEAKRRALDAARQAYLSAVKGECHASNAVALTSSLLSRHSVLLPKEEGVSAEEMARRQAAATLPAVAVHHMAVEKRTQEKEIAAAAARFEDAAEKREALQVVTWWSEGALKVLDAVVSTILRRKTARLERRRAEALGHCIATANAKIAYRVCKQVIGTDWHRLHR